MSSSYWAGLQGKHANLVIRDYPIISLVLHGEWKKRWTIIYKLYRLIYIENQYYEWTSICWLKKKHLCLNRNLIGSFENYLEGIFHAWLESLGIQESFLHYGANPQVSHITYYRYNKVLQIHLKKKHVKVGHKIWWI